MLVTASHTPGDDEPITSSMPVKKLVTFRCSIIAPFGRPVEPEVKITYARFSGPTPDSGSGISMPSSVNDLSSSRTPSRLEPNRLTSAGCVTTVRTLASSSIIVIRSAG